MLTVVMLPRGSCRCEILLEKITELADGYLKFLKSLVDVCSNEFPQHLPCCYTIIKTWVEEIIIEENKLGRSLQPPHDDPTVPCNFSNKLSISEIRCGNANYKHTVIAKNPRR